MTTAGATPVPTRTSDDDAPTPARGPGGRHRLTAMIGSGALLVGLLGGVGIGRATTSAATTPSGMQQGATGSLAGTASG